MKFKLIRQWKKSKKIQGESPYSFFIENYKVIYALVILVSYLFLLSYTWPLGFVPVVSAVSLPFVLLGLLVLWMFLWIFALLLWLPFDMWFFDGRDTNLLIGFNNKEWFEKLYFGLFCFVSFLAWVLAVLISPLTVLVAIVLFIGFSHKLLDKVSFSAILTMLLFSGLLYVYVRCEYLFDGLGLLILMSIIYWWYSLIVSGKHDAGKLSQALLIVLFIILMVPLFPSPFKGDGKLIPHPLVEAGLKIVHLGGGIPVEIKHSPQSLTVSGELLFYDGHKAWVHECNIMSIESQKDSKGSNEDTVLVTEIVVQKIKYLNSEKVGCLSKGKVEPNGK